MEIEQFSELKEQYETHLNKANKIKLLALELISDWIIESYEARKYLSLLKHNGYEKGDKIYIFPDDVEDIMQTITNFIGVKR